MIFKKNSKVMVALAVIFSLSISTTQVFAATSINQINQKYIYKLKPNTTEWNKLKPEEIHVKLNIPTDTLNNMSTEALIDSVLDYPLLGDIYCYDNNQKGLEALSNKFNGLSALLKRKDAGEKLLNKYSNSKVTVQSQDEFDKNIFKLTTIETLLAQSDIEKNLTSSQKKQLVDTVSEKRNEKATQPEIYSMTLNTFEDTFNQQTVKDQTVKSLLVATSASYVYTPNGSAVAATYDQTELSSSEKASCNNYVSTNYPSAVKLRDATAKYNCHSYAWYSQSTSNLFWIDDPTKYMTDGSYYRRYSFTPSYNDRIYYAGEHSGIITNAASYVVTSKWGRCGLYSHSYFYCPYSTSNLSLYYR